MESLFRGSAETQDEKDFADDIAGELSRRVVAHYLFAARTAREVSQKDIAEKMGCTQSRVSKLESSPDSEWSVGDVVTYLDTLNLKAQMLVLSKDATIFDEIKGHAFRVRDLLNQMVKMARDDHAIAEGVSKAHIETLANLTRFIVDSLKDLPHFKGKLPPIFDGDGSHLQDMSPIEPVSCDHVVA